MLKKNKGIDLNANVNYLILFFAIFFIDSIFTPISLILARVSSPIFYSFFKVPFVAVGLLGGLFFVFKRFKTESFMLFLCAIVIFSSLRGLVINDLNSTYFSHLYGGLIAFLGFYFGSNVFRGLDSSISRKIDLYIRNVFYCVCFIIVLYFILLKFGILEYYGISTVLPIYFAYFISKRSYPHAVIAFIAILLSGKRVALVQSMFVLFPIIIQALYEIMKDIKYNRKYLISVGVVLLAFYGLFTIPRDLGLLNRFSMILSADWDISEGIYRATGGRNLEIQYGIISLIERPVSFFFGGGYGTFFWEPLGLNEYSSWWRLHYSHFSPLYFILVYGIFFGAYIYVINIKIFKNSFFNTRNFYSMSFIMYFISSFFGSVMFVDFKYWFFAGASLYFIKEREALDV